MKPDYLLASVLKDYRGYDHMVIDADVETIASFLTKNSAAPEILLTEPDGEVFLLAFEDFIDSCSDSRFQPRELHTVLARMKNGEQGKRDIVPMPGEYLKHFQFYLSETSDGDITAANLEEASA